MSDKGKLYRVYSIKLPEDTRVGYHPNMQRTYCEGEVSARDERDALFKISLEKRIPIEDLKAELVR